jgi:isoleucyl-tRNA synthetase
MPQAQEDNFVLGCNTVVFTKLNKRVCSLAVPDKPHFPTEEEKVLEYWTEINAFHKQLELSKGKPEFTFYDGPPFATGLPHYGHIAAGTIKVRTRVQK